MTDAQNMTCLCRTSSRIDTSSVHTDGALCPYNTDEPLATLCPYSDEGFLARVRPAVTDTTSTLLEVQISTDGMQLGPSTVLDPPITEDQWVTTTGECKCGRRIRVRISGHPIPGGLP